MSLKAFHLAFIIISALLAVIFAAWCFSVGVTVAGVASAAGAVGLAAYAVRFVRKSRGIGYL